MSWVEKNRKTNNWGGDDYSGLESKFIEMKGVVILVKVDEMYNILNIFAAI